MPVLHCRFPFPPQEPPVLLPEACSSKCPNYDEKILAKHAKLSPKNRKLRAALRSFAEWFYALGEDYEHQLRHAALLYTREDHSGTCVPKTILFMHYKHIQLEHYGPTMQLSEAARAALKGEPAPSWPNGEIATGPTWNEMFAPYSSRYEDR